MIEIRKEAADIADGKQPRENNVLKNAPHTMAVISLSEDEWKRFVLTTFSNVHVLTRYSAHIHVGLLPTLFLI